MERILLKGRLLEQKEKEREIDLTQSSDLITLRNLLDPYEEDATKLNIEQAKVIFNRWYCSVVNLKDVRKIIARLEKDLNG